MKSNSPSSSRSRKAARSSAAGSLACSSTMARMAWPLGRPPFSASESMIRSSVVPGMYCMHSSRRSRWGSTTSEKTRTMWSCSRLARVRASLPRLTETLRATCRPSDTCRARKTRAKAPAPSMRSSSKSSSVCPAPGNPSRGPPPCPCAATVPQNGGAAAVAPSASSGRTVGWSVDAGKGSDMDGLPSVAAAVEGGTAVFQQAQVNQLFLESFAGGRIDALGDLVEQEVGEAVAGPFQGLADAGRGERLAQRPGQLLGEPGAGQVGMIGGGSAAPCRTAGRSSARPLARPTRCARANRRASSCETPPRARRQRNTPGPARERRWTGGPAPSSFSGGSWPPGERARP